MSEIPEPIWIDLARRLSAISVQHKEKSFAELCDELAKVENDFISQLVACDKAEDVIHVRRAVARRTFSIAIDKRLPATECEIHLNDLTKLGIEDFEDECTFVLMFCRHLICLRDTEKAKSYLDKLREKNESCGDPLDWVTDAIAELHC
jgi:hypothetical protein